MLTVILVIVGIAALAAYISYKHNKKEEKMFKDEDENLDEIEFSPVTGTVKIDPSPVPTFAPLQPEVKSSPSPTEAAPKKPRKRTPAKKISY